MYLTIFPGGIIGFDWILLGWVYSPNGDLLWRVPERERVPYGEMIP